MLGTFVNSSCDLVVAVRELSTGKCFVLASTDIVFYVACKAVILLAKNSEVKFSDKQKKFIDLNFLSPYFLNFS